MSDIPVHSELIHRFLDGDTSEVEQGLLFRELAADRELQSEFQHALAIRNALLAESRNAVIPAALTERIMQAALGSGSTSIAPSIATVSTVPSIIRPLLLVIGSAITGAALMYLLDTRDITASGTQPIAESQVQQTTQVSQSAEVSDDIAALGLPKERVKNSLQKHSSQSTASPSVQTEITTTGSVARFHQASEKRNESISDRAHEIAIEKEQLVWVNTNADQYREPEITSLSTRVIQQPIPVVVAIGDRNLKPILLEDSHEETARQRLSIRALTQATLLQQRALNSPTMWYENLGFGYDYALQQEHYLGVAGGIEYFPLFFVKDDMLRPQLSMLWAGMSYTFEPNLFNAHWIRPSVACIVGASTSGPLTKGLLGIRFEPLTGISTGVHVEFTEVLLRNAGKWYGTQKYNLSYGISAAF